MSVDITRQELYDLVWSRPIMHVAKDFGISGSMLSRICKDRNVPKPPRGYWANLQAASAKKIGRFIKPALPNFPDPDQSFNGLIYKEYADREAARTDDFDPEDLDDPIKAPPAPPTESLEEFKDRIEAIFPDLPTPESITAIHPIVQKLMDYDVTLAALKRRGGWDSNYRWKVERRKSEIERREYEIQLAAAKKRKVLKKLLASRVELMDEAVANMNSADKIRELIATMQAKADATGSTVKGMKRWIGWATHHANTIDPRSRSLEGFEVWLKKFQLKH